MEGATMSTKACSKCKREKSMSDFYKDANTADGLRCECKTCHKEYVATWRNENREEYNASMRAYRAGKK